MNDDETGWIDDHAGVPAPGGEATRWTSAPWRRALPYQVAAGVLAGVAAVAFEALRVGRSPVMTLVPVEAVVAAGAGLGIGWVGLRSVESNDALRAGRRADLFAATIVVAAYLLTAGIDLLLGMVKVGGSADIPGMFPTLMLFVVVVGVIALPAAARISHDAVGAQPADLREAADRMPATVRDLAAESGLRSGPTVWPLLSVPLAVAGTLPAAAIVVLSLWPGGLPARDDPLPSITVLGVWAGLSVVAWVLLVRWGRRRGRLARDRRDAAVASDRRDAASGSGRRP